MLKNYLINLRFFSAKMRAGYKESLVRPCSSAALKIRARAGFYPEKSAKTYI